MENASKALIIAGAILLSILIIAIGMYIYNSSTNSITNAAGQISQQDIQAFNNQFIMYEGKQVGTNVKALLTTIASICKENAEEKTRLPDVHYKAKSDGDYETVATNLQSVTDDDEKIQTALNKVRTAIESRHYYDIEYQMCPDTGLIDMVIIKYDAGDDYGEVEGNDHSDT